MIMQLEIEKHYFYELSGIQSLKTHLEKISQLEKQDTKATGQIEINLSYTDQSQEECFQSLSFPFELELSELTMLDVQLTKTNLAVVEGQGLEIDCKLCVDYTTPKQDQFIEIDPIEEVEIKTEPESIPLEETKQEHLEKIKEDISKNYEDKLADSLNERQENTVIATKTHLTEDSFLSFLEDNTSQYFKLKCLYVEKEEDLNEIAKEYQISLSKLLAGYDRQNHKVVFTVEPLSL